MSRQDTSQGAGWSHHENFATSAVVAAPEKAAPAEEIAPAEEVAAKTLAACSTQVAAHPTLHRLLAYWESAREGSSTATAGLLFLWTHTKN